MIRLPDSFGPELRTTLFFAIACGEPPLTRELRVRRVSAQIPSAAKSVLTLIGHQRIVGLQPEMTVDQPGVKTTVATRRAGRRIGGTALRAPSR